MKTLKKIFTIAAFILMAVIWDGCDYLLEEHPRSQIVPSFFTTPAGLLGGISGVYDDLRGAWGTEGFTVAQMAGTDEHLMGGSAGNPRLFTYNGILSTDFNGGFNLYTDINTLNGILEFGPQADIPAATLQAYMGQAQFLRAFIYFYLVQTYGAIPLHTEFITEATAADTRAPVQEVYAVIIQDLIDASANLPNTPTAPFLGKAATKAAAQWLLAKAYLTRGWLTDDMNDFTQAYTVASDIITNKGVYGLDLWQNYADAFKPANDYGKETIFVSDHSNDVKYGHYQAGASGGASQNVSPWMGLFNGPSVIGINSVIGGSGGIQNTGPQMLFRDVQFGRPYTRIRPNTRNLTSGPNAGKSYILDQAFADRVNDSRYDKTFQTLWIANLSSTGSAAYAGNGTTGSRGTLLCGVDTAVYMPSVAVAGAPQAIGARPFKGIVVNPQAQTNTVFPHMKKLADPSRSAPNDPSTRPVVIARFADVYLIAAEAAFKLGNNANATAMINVIRQRAAFRTNTCSNPTPPFPLAGPGCDKYDPGVTQLIAEAAQLAATPNPITLDFILDERTREFYGESQRWLDLVRTKSLVTRLQAWNNVEASFVQSFNMLRPIPQDQIDRVTVGEKFPQNPGY